MYLALIRYRGGLARGRGDGGFFRCKMVCSTAGILGFLMTAAGVAFVPSSSVQDVWNFELTTILGTLNFLIPAVFLFRVNVRKVAESIPQKVNIHPD